MIVWTVSVIHMLRGFRRSRGRSGSTPLRRKVFGSEGEGNRLESGWTGSKHSTLSPQALRASEGEQIYPRFSGISDSLQRYYSTAGFTEGTIASARKRLFTDAPQIATVPLNIQGLASSSYDGAAPGGAFTSDDDS
ncbi:unnamed protein product [Pleuronectes platessa]|uniref:Uncharacterized protein n=1 Tax=Pleuronectes platessa TaxID=8262 RepID=A0A9N7URD8_PLEPL|nr:unnamed protein product [Pleuronectes platessa]